MAEGQVRPKLVFVQLNWIILDIILAAQLVAFKRQIEGHLPALAGGELQPHHSKVAST